MKSGFACNQTGHSGGVRELSGHSDTVGCEREHVTGTLLYDCWIEAAQFVNKSIR